ncbi:MAG: glycosyl hydrolase family 28 protein [Eubacteriales bacterium]|nr:glycosyl hydrolase family 28 protein [Eubacteriales bacterium]
MAEVKITTMALEDSITQWWEPQRTKDGKRRQYRILLDGQETAVTEKTYLTIENLEPDREYSVEILPVDGGHFVSACIRTSPEKRRLDVTKAPYLAAGDGKAMDTRAIQQAIDDCGPEEKVYLPAGIYKTGALRLHSNMELYLEEGAVLQGTACQEDYLPRIKSRFEGTEMECYSSLLNLGELNREGGYSCENVLIRGKGVIASGGQALARSIIESERIRLREYLKELGDKVQECENLDTIPGRVRPRLINISNSRNIRISGLTLANGASWNVHMIYSDGIVTDHCTFRSEGVWNGDGWDPDSSTNCTLFACEFYTGDDSVAVKSGKNPEGNRINKPSRGIRIFDCRCMFGHGIALGSEMSGGIEDVYIWDCDLSRSMYGIEVKATRKRGGYVREIRVENCRVPRIMMHSVLYNDDGEDSGSVPYFENCRIRDTEITGRCLDDKGCWQECTAVELCGFDEPGHEVSNVEFSNVAFGPGVPAAISLRRCRNVTFENISQN